MGNRRPLRKVQHLDPHHLPLFVIIDDNPGGYFFGFTGGDVAEAQVEGIRLVVNFQFYGAILLRSKYTITIRGGETKFTITRNTRLSNLALPGA